MIEFKIRRRLETTAYLCPIKNSTLGQYRAFPREPKRSVRSISSPILLSSNPRSLSSSLHQDPHPPWMTRKGPTLGPPYPSPLSQLRLSLPPRLRRRSCCLPQAAARGCGSRWISSPGRPPSFPGSGCLRSPVKGAGVDSLPMLQRLTHFLIPSPKQVVRQGFPAFENLLLLLASCLFVPANSRVLLI